MDQKDFRLIEIELELRVNAPIERVYKALTDELDAWWPHRYKPDSTVHVDVSVGGKIEERFKDGGGALYGEILYLDPPIKIITGGASCLCRCYSAYSSDSLEPIDGGTVIKRKFQIWGAVAPDAEEMYRSGTTSILKKALADYLERGIGYSPAGSK